MEFADLKGALVRKGEGNMLIIVLLLCLLTFFFVAYRRRDPLSFYLLGLSASNCLMFAGIIIYIAKMGGLAAANTSFLFFSVGLQRWLQFLALPMDRLGYAVAVGRTLFPLFAVFAALELTMVFPLRRRNRLLRRGLCLLPILFLLYYFPPLFEYISQGRLYLVLAMIPAGMGYIGGYLLLATILIIIEYRSITTRFYRKNFGYILLSILSMEALYVFYATKDPAQIYNLYISEYIQLGIATYIGPNLSTTGWIILMIGTVIFVTLGSYGLLRYTKVEYDEGRQDMILQRKFDTAGSGISVFVHGIKNQLLASRVLHKKLNRALQTEPPDIEAIQTVAARLIELNEGMLSRMDELYRSVKSNALILRPVSVNAVVASAISRFHDKYPEVSVEVRGSEIRVILADLPHLSEAVYNLLANGYEAACRAERSLPQVTVTIHNERLWTVLEVRDNGSGIPAGMDTRIFEPFYTDKNTNYNWGMGLYYVRKIVKEHWGKLRLESQSGEGASFFVMLPRYDSDRRRRDRR